SCCRWSISTRCLRRRRRLLRSPAWSTSVVSHAPLTPMAVIGAGSWGTGLGAAGDLGEVLEGAPDVLIAVPSSAFRSTLGRLKPRLDADARVAWASKGFETSTGLLPHQVAAEVLGTRPGAVLSGPTFAREVGAGLPTAMTIASRDAGFAEEL